jgi:hypothetical protein
MRNHILIILSLLVAPTIAKANIRIQTADGKAYFFMKYVSDSTVDIVRCSSEEGCHKMYRFKASLLLNGDLSHLNQCLRDWGSPLMLPGPLDAWTFDLAATSLVVITVTVFKLYYGSLITGADAFASIYSVVSWAISPFKGKIVLPDTELDMVCKLSSLLINYEIEARDEAKQKIYVFDANAKDFDQLMRLTLSKVLGARPHGHPDFAIRNPL